MSHKVIVPTLDLQIGMFVSDLDRPWIETPFLMQGLLVENEAQITILQQHCQRVSVDRSRSSGEAYAPRNNSKDAPRQPGPLPKFQQASEAQPDDFAKICRHLRLQPISQRYRHSPALEPTDQQSRLEAELLYSAPLVDDVKNTLKSIREALTQSQNVSLKEISGQVSQMARAIERNPDAMIWLARLRSADQYSYDHALDVSVHLMVFARFLSLPMRAIEQVGLAGMMMDIGKIDIPAEILAKPGDLTAEEYTLVQSHVAMLTGNVARSGRIPEQCARNHCQPPRTIRWQRLPAAPQR